MLQLYIPSDQPFSMELGIKDDTGAHRRLFLSVAFSEVKGTPLHYQLPLGFARRDEWINLVLDLEDLVSILPRA